MEQGNFKVKHRTTVVYVEETILHVGTAILWSMARRTTTDVAFVRGTTRVLTAQESHTAKMCAISVAFAEDETMPSNVEAVMENCTRFRFDHHASIGTASLL
jgi:hypothetical protein